MILTILFFQTAMTLSIVAYLQYRNGRKKLLERQIELDERELELSSVIESNKDMQEVIELQKLQIDQLKTDTFY